MRGGDVRSRSCTLQALCSFWPVPRALVDNGLHTILFSGCDSTSPRSAVVLWKYTEWTGIFRKDIVVTNRTCSDKEVGT